jgi:hypothetical protein
MPEVREQGVEDAGGGVDGEGDGGVFAAVVMSLVVHVALF